MQQKTIRRAALTIPVFILAACSGKQDAPEAPKGAPPQQVEAIIVTPAALDDIITATGSLLSNEEVEIRSESSGRIVGLYFTEGQYVQAGSTLLQIDDSELRAQSKKTELSIQLAEEDEARKKKLLDINGISKEDYDVALNNLLKLRAEKQLLDAQIAKTAIHAPFSGTIGLRNFSNGAFVTPNDLIAVLQQTDPVKLEFSVPEKYAGTLQKGAKLHFTVENHPEDFMATLYAIEPKIDPQTRTVRMRATCPNTKGILIPGAFAKIDLTLTHTDDALTVPAEAIIPTIAGQQVMLLKNGIATLTPVTTGIRTESIVELTSGIAAGDTVIVTGLLTLRNGMPATPIIASTEKE